MVTRSTIPRNRLSSFNIRACKLFDVVRCIVMPHVPTDTAESQSSFFFAFLIPELRGPIQQRSLIVPREY